MEKRKNKAEGAGVEPIAVACRADELIDEDGRQMSPESLVDGGTYLRRFVELRGATLYLRGVYRA